MYNFKEKYQFYLNIFEEYLEKNKEVLTTMPNVLGESMQYSLFSGGKRIRPVLLLAVAEVLGLNFENVLPFAFAIEMIHTYSLIHDDLPAMDNDDFRRGKLSNHKQFGEATAILAGDGLLNTAYSVCFQAAARGSEYLRAAQYLCDCAGVKGMIAGQTMDLEFSNRADDLNDVELEQIHRLKTGKLIAAPVLIPSILTNYKNYFELEDFAQNLGLLFQITDDILDEEGSFEKVGKTIGKDQAKNKFTFVKAYGLNGAKIQADLYASNCVTVLDALNGDVTFLHDLVGYVRTRDR